MPQLAGTRVLLGISAGIAAYKSAHLARLLKKADAQVRVVMTEGAQAFITPLTLQALTGEAVRTSLLDPESEAGMGHIELAKWADLILIAPATADLMARLAHGHADDLLTTLCLASEAQCLMAPAMNQAMWRHPATQRNAQRLTEDGWRLLGPAGGEQACGDVGPGRMQEPEEIVAAIQAMHAMPASGNLARGLTVTLTAGPTREAIDPVRYLTNHSSGKMGYALAAAFARQGARVRLISGPVSLPAPPDVERIDVVSTQEMFEAASQTVSDTHIFIGCAAVADYRAEQVNEHKLKKTAGDDALTLRLVKNPDIIAELAARPDRPFMVGFAAETRDLETYARDKLARKGLDLIVANDVSQQGLGFGSDDNAVLLLWPAGDAPGREFLPAQAKTTLAEAILHRIIDRYRQTRNTFTGNE
ncbi:bifunctional phosphopantothenoylcysteine decarboxylase/phosphopantothenate--cysteine ligase CoaBC [Halomonas sp. WWR20]